MVAITIERNEASRSRNANRSTNPNTSGACDFIRLLKSAVAAVWPVTATSVPGTAPIVEGMTSFRSVLSAEVDVDVGAAAGERDRDLGDGAVGADLEHLGVVHLRRGVRLREQLLDPVADGRGVHALRLDGDDRGLCAARVQALEVVEHLDLGDAPRQRSRSR